MSVGNLKDSGNQSNNFPWQLKMLQGLQALIDSNKNCCAETLPILSEIIQTIQPQARTVKIGSTDTTGATDTGSYSVSIANVGTAEGLVNGVPLPAGVTLNFDAGVLNNYLEEITFDATNTVFLVTQVQQA